MSVNSMPNYKKAIAMAQDLLKQQCLNEPPVIARQLAEHYGLSVVGVRLGEINPNYKIISGFIDTDTNTMYVNTGESPQRQNFTIAHELGHYLLEHTKTSEYSTLFRRPIELQSNIPMEQEANCFAANLLVPEKFLKDIIKRYPFATNNQLANIFGVSEAVIRFRKMTLGV